MNAPDRYERFVVPEGTKKVSYERDTKIINAAAFTIEREDHTIGNILRMQLHRDENVLFAGYKLPHPLQYKIIVRIHTTSQSSPMQAYNQAIDDLDKELNHLRNAFERLSTPSTEKAKRSCDVHYVRQISVKDHLKRSVHKTQFSLSCRISEPEDGETELGPRGSKKELELFPAQILMELEKLGKGLGDCASPKQKGDWKDVMLMSLSFAVLVYMSQRIVCAYCAWKSLFHSSW